MLYSPLISIILATFNSEEFLDRCLISITNQLYTNYELIVIDGKSTDRTTAIIKKYSSNIKYWESTPDNGIYHAWNKALKQSSGEWIIFIGSDDFLYDKFTLKNSIRYLNEALVDGIRFVYGKTFLVDRYHPTNIIEYLGDKDYSEYKKNIKNFMEFSHTCLFHHRSLFDEHGYFCESYIISGDYEFILRELSDINKSARKMDIPTVFMSSGGISTSSRKRILSFIECIKARRANSIYGINIQLLLLGIKTLIIFLIDTIFDKTATLRIANIYRSLLNKNIRISIQ